jgi:hypothetical protein
MQEKRGKGIIPARLVTFQPIAGVVAEGFCAKTAVLASALGRAKMRLCPERVTYLTEMLPGRN